MMLLLYWLFLCATSTSFIHTYGHMQWESSHYIWNFCLIASSDKGITRNPEEYFLTEPTFNKNRYKNIKSGDIVWIQCRFIPEFCKDILPGLKHSIVLLISDGDDSFPSDCNNNFDINILLNHPCIVHIFAQNCDYIGLSKKVSQIPIGMDFHTIAYKGTNGGWGEKGSPEQQEAILNTILKTLKPTSQRKKRAFVDFQHSDTMHASFQRYLQFKEDRSSIFQRLLLTGLIDHGPRIRRSNLWRKKGEYAFSISPHGNGLDCHRTWEDLILGCIVIVKTSPLDHLYKELPVVIINDWSEITANNMDKWLSQYGDAFTNPVYRKKLTNEYWLSKIKTIAQHYKK